MQERVFLRKKNACRFTSYIKQQTIKCSVSEQTSVEMKLLILSALLAASWAAPTDQYMTFNDDGSYRFYYETGKEGGSHSRSEFRDPDGVVIGKFSFEDPDGELREVNYRADNSGFVAEGDVSVKGAPKGQFPAAQDEQQQDQTPAPTTTAPELPAGPKEPQPKAEKTITETHDDEEDKAQMQDLILEESSSNDPPEAFPPGFFLEKFQGLRRLPEPTPENKPTTTESPKIPEKQNQENAKEEKKDSEGSSAAKEKSVGESAISVPSQSFSGHFPQQWESAMFHQPVYVFAYNQPDAYGYHYFY